MARKRFVLSQISLFAIVGTVTALIVWALAIWSVHGIWHPAKFSVERVWTTKLYTVLVLYLSLGACLGVSVTMVQPVWDSAFGQAIRNEWRWLLLGALLGAVGIVLGGLCGEYVLDRHPNHLVGRIVGALVMGLGTGIALGIVEKWRTGSYERLLAGIVGGALGGTIAGVIFQLGANSNPAVASALAMMSFGGLVTGAIGAVAFLKARAKIVGTPKNTRKYDRWERELLNDTKNIIGSALTPSQKATIKIYDQSILPEHAVICYDMGSGEWLIQRYSPAVRDIFVNGDRLTDEVRPLRSGDIIGIGKNLEFRFEVER